MAQAIIIAFSVFLGWTLLDFVKKKKLTKENLVGSLIVAIIAGGVWYILELVLSFL